MKYRLMVFGLAIRVVATRWPAKVLLQDRGILPSDERCAARDNKLRNNEEVLDLRQIEDGSTNERHL